MKIKFRLLKIDPKEHSIYVRFYTDILTEEILANEFDINGNIIRDEKGHPIRCRTDFHINIWQTPSPTGEELEKFIISHAPVAWFKLQEDIANPEINTDLSAALALQDQEIEFEPEDPILSKELSDEEIDKLLEQLTSKV